MTGFLLDTNVVSELTRDAPDPRVLSFLSRRDDLWLSVIVLHELDFGIALLPPGRRGDRIRAAISAFVAQYGDRVLPLGREASAMAAAFRAQARHSGRVLDLGDALIAGTARANALSLATRNIRDFEGLGLDVLDPWT